MVLRCRTLSVAGANDNGRLQQALEEDERVAPAAEAVAPLLQYVADQRLPCDARRRRDRAFRLVLVRSDRQWMVPPEPAARMCARRAHIHTHIHIHTHSMGLLYLALRCLLAPPPGRMAEDGRSTNLSVSSSLCERMCLGFVSDVHRPRAAVSRTSFTAILHSLIELSHSTSFSLNAMAALWAFAVPNCCGRDLNHVGQTAGQCGPDRRLPCCASLHQEVRMYQMYYVT